MTITQRASKVRADISAHHRTIFSSKEWYYAEPCGKFVTEIMKIYGDTVRDTKSLHFVFLCLMLFYSL